MSPEKDDVEGLGGYYRGPLRNAIVGRVSNNEKKTSSLQDLKNEMTIPVAEATGYTIYPFQGLGASDLNIFRAPLALVSGFGVPGDDLFEINRV